MGNDKHALNNMLYFNALNKTTTFFSLLFIVCLISSCAQTVHVPVTSREFKVDQSLPPVSSVPTAKNIEKSAIPTNGLYTVKSGDTLYSIAWRYGRDFRDVARWNNIYEPYIIYPGQKIKLKPEKIVKHTPTKTLQPGPIVADNLKRQKTVKKVKTKQPKPKLITKPSKPQPKPVTKPAPKSSTNGKIVWRWPTNGKLIRSKQLTSKKGINISGKIGQDIISSAAGRVVYSGSGLLGYGRLIIIKHSETYLSAYAHNSELLVKEGEQIVAAQTIAKMGANNNGQPLLHFEIRKNGKSVNPLTLLPKK